MGYTAEALVAVAQGELGYLEKATNADLDSKTGNPGSGNFTKYARDLYKAGYYQGNKNGYEWCEVFNDWCHWVAAGKDPALAQAVIYQTGLYGAGCTWSANCYRSAGRFFSAPKVGDQAYFGKAGDEDHTGIVAKVTDTSVWIIEGNSANGVRENAYPLGCANIAGYGRPDYQAAYTQRDFVRDVQAACGATVDGIAGPETLSKTVTLSRYKNRRHTAVKAVQQRLTALGYAQVGEIDGIAGVKFQAAVIAYQKDNGCVPDGELTAGKTTWKKILGM